VEEFSGSRQGPDGSSGSPGRESKETRLRILTMGAQGSSGNPGRPMEACFLMKGCPSVFRASFGFKGEDSSFYRTRTSIREKDGSARGQQIAHGTLDLADDSGRGEGRVLGLRPGPIAGRASWPRLTRCATCAALLMCDGTTSGLSGRDGVESRRAASGNGRRRERRGAGRRGSRRAGRSSCYKKLSGRARLTSEAAFGMHESSSFRGGTGAS